MTQLLNEPCDYFAAPAHSYWCWSDRGGAVAWCDQRTIAFRQELSTVLGRLRGQRLPPLGAILLVLAACRDNWREAPSRLGLLAGVLTHGEHPSETGLLEVVFTQLHRLHDLSPAVRHSVEAKGELVAMLCEPGEADWSDVLDSVLESLEHGLPEGYTKPWLQLKAMPALLGDLAWLRPRLKHVDERALLRRMEVGIDGDILPAPIEIPAVASPRGLIAELQNDPELGGVARLARRLLATLLLPRPLGREQDLPVGGVTDISNRGSFDRLLLSELAHDGLTLAVRVATNEALFLEREMPPRTPALRRIVLLDAGLCSWGVPRIFITAVGLALAAGADKQIDLDVFRADQNGLARVDLSTSKGLLAHLSALDDRLHPGEALPELAEQAEAIGGASDLILVIPRDVADDADFRRAVASALDRDVFLAIVDRSGDFELQLQTSMGRKSLSRCQLDLDQLLAPTASPTAPLVDAKDRLQPAIFGVEPFPLLVPAPVDQQRSWHVAGLGALTYTRDNRLLLWSDRDHGPRQLAAGLPAGALHWAAPSVDGNWALAAIGKLSDQGLYALRVSFDGREVSCVPLEGVPEQPVAVYGHRGQIVTVGRQWAVAFGALTGRKQSTRALDGNTHFGGRFFRDRLWREWLTPNFFAGEPGWEVVHVDDSSPEKIIAVFDCSGAPGPVGFTQSGDLYSFGHSQLRRVFWEFKRVCRFVAASRDGAQIVVKQEKLGMKDEYFVLTTHSLALAHREAFAWGDRCLERELWQIARPQVVRTKFVSVAINHYGRLVLANARGHWAMVDFHTATRTIKLHACPPPSLRIQPVQFETLEARPSTGISLKVAKFADGSRVTLDGRGLLHLCSSDSELPECTVVLHDGPTAGWVANGLCWGPEYFVGAHPSVEPHVVWRDVLQPFVERLA